MRARNKATEGLLMWMLTLEALLSTPIAGVDKKTNLAMALWPNGFWKSLATKGVRCWFSFFLELSIQKCNKKNANTQFKRSNTLIPTVHYSSTIFFSHSFHIHTLKTGCASPSALLFFLQIQVSSTLCYKLVKWRIPQIYKQEIKNKPHIYCSSAHFQPTCNLLVSVLWANVKFDTVASKS